MNNKFVWAKYPVPDQPKKLTLIGHVIDVGSDMTYCGTHKTELPGRSYSKGMPAEDPPTISRLLCLTCQKENQKRLAIHYGIKDWS